MLGLELTELNSKVVDSFINKITVWDEKHIEIEWKFQDSNNALRKL